MIKELITHYNCWKYKVDKTVWIRPRVTIQFRERISFGHHIEIGEGSYVSGIYGITFGDYVLLSPNVGIFTADHQVPIKGETLKGKPVKIGNNVWIGSGSVIVKGVNIGDNVIIGANSTITKDIPSNCTVVGLNRIIKTKR